jgi:Fe-S-cluster containining protein
MSASLNRALKALLVTNTRLRRLAEVVEAKLAAAFNNGQGRTATGKFANVVIAADREMEVQKQLSHEPIPCKAGCNHCCSFQEVVISVAEATLLVRHIEQRMSPEERSAARNSILSSGTTGANRNSPCALLTPGGCSVYESRPMPCRSYHSSSEAACRACRTDGAPYPKVNSEGFAIRAHVIGMLAIKVSRAYAHSGRYEINALLRRIYSDPTKPAQWAAENPTDETSVAKTSLASQGSLALRGNE